MSDMVRIVGGNPTEEEAAAAVAVISGLLASGHRRKVPRELSTISGGWKSYWRVVRSPLHPGQEAWRSTFRL